MKIVSANQGFIGVLLVAAARLRRVPVVVHEANASAGWANKLGVRGARRVLSAVEDPGLPGAEVVGVPVRAAITSLDRMTERAKARAHFGFADDARVLLVFGGSQGAQSINRAVAPAAKDLAAAGISVLHAHGPKNTLDLRDQRLVHVSSFQNPKTADVLLGFQVWSVGDKHLAVWLRP